MVQPLPEEQMLSWRIISICKISHQESKHEPFLLPSPQPPPLSSALPWPCHCQTYYIVSVSKHAITGLVSCGFAWFASGRALASSRSRQRWHRSQQGEGEG